MMGHLLRVLYHIMGDGGVKLRKRLRNQYVVEEWKLRKRLKNQ